MCIRDSLWGRGIVDPPESNFDGRALTQYLTKYIAKDLGKIQFDPQTVSYTHLDVYKRQTRKRVSQLIIGGSVSGVITRLGGISLCPFVCGLSLIHI